MSPTYFITAPTGNIGKRLVPVLLSRTSNSKLVLPTRDAARLISLLPDDIDKTRIHVAEGNIQDPGFVQNLLEQHQVTGVFLCLTGEDELFTTFNLLAAIRDAKCVKHLVYLSACGHYDLETAQSGFMRDVWAGHVAVKFLVEAKLKHGLLPRDQEGGSSYTILGPSLFFDNDLGDKNGKLNGGYFGEPLGSKGVSRVDAADIALAAAIALDDDGKKYAEKKIMIGSLKTYTMSETAELWSKALGKEMKYGVGEAGLMGFEEHVRPYRGAAWARDLRSMFEMFEKYEFCMSEEEYKEQVSILGKEAASYEQFVEDVAKDFKKEA